MFKRLISLQYISLVILLLAIQAVNGQDSLADKQLLYKAEEIYRSKQNLDQAVKIYRAAFEKKVLDVSVIIDAISCATKIQDTISAKLFIEKGILAGLVALDIEKLWSSIGNDLDYESVIMHCDTITNKKEYKSRLNYALIDSLNLLADRDQEHRSSDEDNWELQKRNDSLNWRELKEITKRCRRLPAYSEIGFDGTENLEILFYHMDKNELEWFLPLVIKSIEDGESHLGEVLLYQIERIGMSEGVIYSITDGNKIEQIAIRTKMNNGYFCQTFGEWFTEKSQEDLHLYFVPLDPNIPEEEINRVRELFFLDRIESRWKREPWVKLVSMEEFEKMIRG